MRRACATRSFGAICQGRGIRRGRNLASAVLTQMLSSPSETISVPPVETDLGRQKGKR